MHERHNCNLIQRAGRCSTPLVSCLRKLILWCWRQHTTVAHWRQLSTRNRWLYSRFAGSSHGGPHMAQPQEIAPSPALPAFPVNGHGGFIPAVPIADGLAWLLGSSYERDCETPEIKPQDHHENLARLKIMLPWMAAQLGDQFNAQQVHGWAGIRCATPGRLPILGRIATAKSGADVWVCTGMGSRGLTFAGLCAELLAARLHGEPLPIENRLVQALTLTAAPTSH